MSGTDALYFTETPEANRLLAENPFALLIGLALYQQVPIEKAFIGPYALQERIGGELSAPVIASAEPDSFEEIFRRTPAIHRFPASMAKRIQALAAYIVDECDGDATVLWDDVADATSVLRNIKRLPGFGDYKAKVTFTVLASHFDVRPEGWGEAVANFPTVTDIDGPGQLEEFKARKKAWKAR